MKPLKTILTYALLWIVWHGSNSLSLLTTYHAITAKEWQYIVYNYTSIIIVYHTSYATFRHYFKRFSFAKFQQLNVWQKIGYAAKLQPLAILMIVAAYVALSVWIDVVLMGIKTPSIFINIDRRFLRIRECVLFAAIMASYITYKKRQRGLTKARNNAYKQLQKKVLKFNELDEQIKGETWCN
jgi:hypothetical protein